MITNKNIPVIKWKLRRSVRLYLWWRRRLCVLGIHTWSKLTGTCRDRYIRCLACGKWLYADHSDLGIEFDGKRSNIILPYPEWYKQAYYAHKDKVYTDYTIGKWRYI